MSKKIAVFLLFVLLAFSAGAQRNVSVPLCGGSLFGNLYTNDADPLLSGVPRPVVDPPYYNGFRELYYSKWPSRNLTSVNALNFEFMLNGKLVDPNPGIMIYDPRLDYCTLQSNQQNIGILNWDNQYAYYGIDSGMQYEMTEKGIDMKFSATPRQPFDSTGWVGFMWASYISGAISREIHFYGVRIKPYNVYEHNCQNPWPHPGDAQEPTSEVGWITFGGDEDYFLPGEGTLASKLAGTIGHLGTEYLDISPESKMQFSWENPYMRFVRPIYYGLTDGDGDFSTTGDTMAWIMMFDDPDAIRLAMWNFTEDTHRPAWDWEYIIQDPQIGQSYGYKARLVYKPFVSEEDVMREYVLWQSDLGEYKPCVKLYTGQTAELSVAEVNDCSFQWKFESGVTVMSGPKTPSWTIGPATKSVVGSYWCELSLGGGIYPAKKTVVEVADHLAIVSGPVGGEKTASLPLSVSVTGGFSPFFYQWKKNGVVIPGATKASFSALDSGSYEVQVSDSGGDTCRSLPTLVTVKRSSFAELLLKIFKFLALFKR